VTFCCCISPLTYIHVHTHRLLPSTASWLAADGVYNLRPLLALVYAVACATRSILPRYDCDRLCFWEHPLSNVMVGRTLATVAELSFAALVAIALARSAITVRWVQQLATVLFAVNVVAQTCCWYSVITQDQRGHVIEETIWMLSALAVGLTASVIPEDR
jgi:hypothetical protein